MRFIPLMLMLMPMLGAGPAPSVVATLDGEPVTAQAMERAAESASPYGKRLLISPVARQQTLDRIIETRVLAKAGAQSGVDKSAAFQARLEEARLTIVAALELDRHVAANSTDKDVAAFFAKDPTRFGTREIRASHVLVDDAATAEKALAEARAPGADFVTIVRRYNKGPSADKDGALGWFGRGRMLLEFETAAFATPAGEVHPKVVKTSFGYHVIKVEETRGEDKARLEQVKAQVKEALELELRQTYVQSLKTRAKIVIDQQALAKLGTN